VGDSPVMVWDSVPLRSSGLTIPSTSFETWFSRAQPLDYSNGSLVIALPDSFKKGASSADTARRSRASRPQSVGASIVAGPRPRSVSRRGAASDRERRDCGPRTSGTLPLNPDYTFAALVRGGEQPSRCRRLRGHGRCGRAQPQEAYNPLFVYGGVGLGKTHLLQAIGNAVAAADPSCSVVYTTSERFAIELITAIRTTRRPVFARSTAASTSFSSTTSTS